MVLVLVLFSLLWLVGCGRDDAASTAASATPTTVSAADVDQGETPLLVYERAGDEEGAVLAWRVYRSGRAVALTTGASGETTIVEGTVDTTQLDQLVADLTEVGFFDIATPETFDCCAQYDYVISAAGDEGLVSIAIEHVTPQLSPPRLQTLTVVEKFLFEAVTLPES
jgi:hypothetical protein